MFIETESSKLDEVDKHARAYTELNRDSAYSGELLDKIVESGVEGFRDAYESMFEENMTYDEWLQSLL